MCTSSLVCVCMCLFHTVSELMPIVLELVSSACEKKASEKGLLEGDAYGKFSVLLDQMISQVSAYTARTLCCPPSFLLQCYRQLIMSMCHILPVLYPTGDGRACQSGRIREACQAKINQLKSNQLKRMHIRLSYLLLKSIFLRSTFSALAMHCHTRPSITMQPIPPSYTLCLWSTLTAHRYTHIVYFLRTHSGRVLANEF